MDGCRSIFVAARQHDGRDGQRTWFGLAASGVQRDGNKRCVKQAYRELVVH